MPRYCVTLELKLMKGIWFDAENDEEAVTKTKEIHEIMTAESMADGYETWDHELTREDRDEPIIPWEEER